MAGSKPAIFIFTDKMSEFRKFSAARTLVKMDDISSLYGDYVIVCVPADALYVARRLLSERGSWPVTFVRNYVNADGYSIPNAGDDDFIRYLSSVAEFLGAKDMSCDITTSLSGIESAIRQLNLCGAGAIAYPDGSIRYGSGYEMQTSSSDADAQGKGFLSVDDEVSHKCSAANAIVDGLILSLNNLSVLTAVNLIGGGVVVGVGLIANPPLAVFALLAGLSISMVSFGVLASAIDANRQSLVCALFNSENTIDAYDNFHQALSDLVVDIGPLELNIGAVAQLLGSFATTDVINALYGNVGLPEVNNPVTCGSCSTDFYINSYQGVICGSLQAGFMAVGYDFDIQSVTAPAFGDNRKQVRIAPNTTGQYTVELSLINSGGEAAFFIDGLDWAGDYFTINWSASLTSPIQCNGNLNVIGSTIGGGGSQFEVRYNIT